MSEQQAYPLTWPEGWPRTAPVERQSSRFLRNCRYAARFHSMSESVDFLSSELSRLNADKTVLSTNVALKLNGDPYSNRSAPTDPGAAVYFELNGKPTSLACDKWLRVEDNIYAIAKHIEALRGQERWGVGSIARAFTGYQALPAPGESTASDWWKTLGVTINATEDQVKEAYRLLVKKHHPDNGGDQDLFRRVQQAYEKFCQSEAIA